MMNEQSIKASFIKFNSEYLNTEELQEYEDSLDCALAVVLECERLGVDYPASYEHVRRVIQEPGEFWDACLLESRAKLGELPNGQVFDNLYTEKAIAIGFDVLLEAFQEGL